MKYQTGPFSTSQPHVRMFVRNQSAQLNVADRLPPSVHTAVKTTPPGSTCQLPRVCNCYCHGWLAAAAAHALYLPQEIHALHDVPEHHMLAVQMRRGNLPCIRQPSHVAWSISAMSKNFDMLRAA